MTVLLGGLVLLGAWLAPALAGDGTSNAQPADKVVASGSKLTVIGPNDEVVLLAASMKTSSPTDLILSVSMECSIFTRLVTGPSDDGGTDTAMATGRVRAWVEVDGVIVPVNSDSAAPAPGDDSDKVTFCDRTYQRTVTDAEDPLDGQDIEDDFIATKAANAFHWIRLNLGHGVHDVVVKASLVQVTTGDANAEAAVGNRVLVVEPTKMANNAIV